VVVSHHAKFELITTTESRFFRTVFVEICTAAIDWPLFRKLAEVTREAHTVVEGRFPANCLLYGLEIFVAAAVIKGITCVVQCYNNKIQPPSWYFVSSMPCEWTRNGKMDNVRTHTQCKF